MNELTYLSGKIIGGLLSSLVYLLGCIHIPSLQLRQAPQSLQDTVHIAAVAKVLQTNVPAPHLSLGQQMCMQLETSPSYALQGKAGLATWNTPALAEHRIVLELMWRLPVLRPVCMLCSWPLSHSNGKKSARPAWAGQDKMVYKIRVAQRVP